MAANTGAAQPAPININGTNVAMQAPPNLTMPKNTSIAGITASLQNQQNQANQANTVRQNQGLGVLANGSQTQAAGYTSALNSLNSGYTSAAGQFANSMANNQTVANNENAQINTQAQQAAGAAQQNAASRGLTNSTVATSMQDQVNRATQAAQGNVAASLAQNNNAVSSQLAGLDQNQGNASASLQAQGANAGMQTSSGIANYIAAPNQQGPDASMYAPLVQQAAAAAQQHPTSTTVTNPVPINSPMYQPQQQGSPYAGQIAAAAGGASLGQGGYSTADGATYYGPGSGNTSAAANNQNQTDPFLSMLGLS
jgi:hypothetical protein